MKEETKKLWSTAYSHHQNKPYSSLCMIWLKFVWKIMDNYQSYCLKTTTKLFPCRRQTCRQVLQWWNMISHWQLCLPREYLALENWVRYYEQRRITLLWNAHLIQRQDKWILMAVRANLPATSTEYTMHIQLKHIYHCSKYRRAIIFITTNNYSY